MELTKFSDYSLRALIYLGLNSDRIVSLAEIADAYDISRNHLVKIGSHLAQQGYIETLRGKGGGIRLAKPPTEIVVGTLVRSTKNNSRLVECFDPATNQCRIASCCSLKSVLRKAEAAFFAELDKVTLADLLRGRNRLKEALSLTPVQS